MGASYSYQLGQKVYVVLMPSGIIDCRVVDKIITTESKEGTEISYDSKMPFTIPTSDSKTYRIFLDRRQAKEFAAPLQEAERLKNLTRLNEGIARLEAEKREIFEEANR